MPHLDPAEVAEFISGRLPAEKLEAVEEHLDACAECRRAASGVARAGEAVPLDTQPATDPVQRAVSVEFAVGDVVDERFRVTRVVGQGAQGLVLEATHLQLNQPVALKLLNEGSVGGSEAARRMVREARAIARLESSHACRVLDVGQTSTGRPFLAMELLRGETLQERLRGGARPSFQQAVEWALQALDAIAEAHRLGIVHRDLKPANLFLAQTRRGEVLKVLDFGIARSDVPDIEQGLHLRTRPHLALGTPLYMAPEQHRGEPADARADVWAVGVVLYELLAGRPPFPPTNRAELRQRILSEAPPPLRTLAPSAPEALIRVVERSLEKSPDARYSSGASQADALRDALHGGSTVQGLEPVARTALEPATRRRFPAPMAIGVGLLLLAGAAAWLVTRAPAPTASDSADAPAPSAPPPPRAAPEAPPPEPAVSADAAPLLPPPATSNGEAPAAVAPAVVNERPAPKRQPPPARLKSTRPAEKPPAAPAPAEPARARPPANDDPLAPWQ